jgi:hypothetical protein
MVVNGVLAKYTRARPEMAPGGSTGYAQSLAGISQERAKEFVPASFWKDVSTALDWAD